ncbi:MAG: FMN-binding negative transcriptional regulator [Acidobacteriota bacterium]
MTINRRRLLLGLLSTPALGRSESLGAQAEAPSDPSLYIPRAHRVEDRAFLHDFMEEYAFVDLVTSTSSLRVTHIPSVLDRTRGSLGTVLGHISAQNLQKGAFDGAHTAVIVFRGPHGYISPSWYGRQDSVVPTWNFGVVHVTGKPRLITDKARAYELLATLIRKNERRVGSTAYDFSAQPQEYVDRMMQGISPFEMPIDTIEGKFKLGQERNEGDRKGVLQHLKAGAYNERSLYEVTEAFYRSPPK